MNTFKLLMTLALTQEVQRKNFKLYGSTEERYVQ